ncbi:hypothetical protein QCE73_37130 [Caballeronia sp. LZ029]|nr:hypothetical protein [Caballeronia sp. LZ029]
MSGGKKTAVDGRPESPEALRTLAECLERALDVATSVVLIRHVPEVCTVYLGDPSEAREKLRKVGTIPRALTDEMLMLTSSGLNQIQIGDQRYRFVRTFTQVEKVPAVVFAA